MPTRQRKQQEDQVGRLFANSLDEPSPSGNQPARLLTSIKTRTILVDVYTFLFVRTWQTAGILAASILERRDPRFK